MNEQLQNTAGEKSFNTTSRKITISKRMVLIISGLVIMAIGVAIFFYYKNMTARSEGGIIATVNNEPVYTSYLDKELEFYPGTKSAEIKKMLEQKIIDDQITLEAAQKEGLIKDYPDTATMSNEEYLKRTDVVQTIKENIDSKRNFIQGKTVMVWFYNNQHIGPGGMEVSKEVAYAKIKPLYDKVKSGEMTIDQAGQIIKADKSIAAIDPAWQSNALAPFKYYKSGTATFWPGYNKILWNTKPGQVTPLYLGGGILRDGKPVEELYIFSQVDKKSDNGSSVDFDQWLEEKKKEYPVVYPAVSSLLRQVMPKTVFAQAESNQNDSNDSSNNGNNGSRSGSWSGMATTMTGLPLPGVAINILSSCNGPRGRNEITGANGRYNTGTDYNLSCLCNPQTFTATYNGESCTLLPSNYTRGSMLSPLSGITVPNGDATMEQDIVCGPPPPPTPTPVQACNSSCIRAGDCIGDAMKDGCTACLPNAAGTGKTCQKQACNARCETRDDCSMDAVKNQNNCTECIPDATGVKTCQPAPTPTPTPILMCNKTCTTSSECELGVDGCTACLPNDEGTGTTCRPTPACGTACTRDGQCAGARDGCTICNAGKCSAFSDNMCSCDGIDFSVAGGKTTFFPGDDVTFIAYGIVPGKDWKGAAETAVNNAIVTSIQFSLFQSSLTNPNAQATRLAQSTKITPEIIENSGGKVRYKVTWNQKIPSTVPSGSVFRVLADVKCSAKPGVLGAATQSLSINYYAELVGMIQGLVTNTKSVLQASTQNQQQASSFFPGVKISEKSCNVMKFYFE